MAAENNPMIVDSPAGDPVMTLTRMLDAPRELVWETFTNAEHIANWWGPTRYAINVEVFDVRPGGQWRITHTDGGKTVVFFGEYREVVKPARLVRTFRFQEFNAIEETYEFHDEGGKTRLVCTQRYPNITARDWMAKSGAAEGGREAFARLDTLLASLKGQK